MTQHLFRFFIIERDSFIGQDMRAGLIEACPEAEATWLRSTEDLPLHLQQAPTAAALVIITSLGLEAIRETGLAALADEHHARIVTRQGSVNLDDLHRLGWLTLPSPFSTADLAEMVAQLTDMKTADPRVGRSQVVHPDGQE